MKKQKVIFNMSVSLDGFIARPNDEFEEVFKWYGSGDTDFQFPGTNMVFKISKASIALLQESIKNVGAIVTGRRNFDVARAWGGHPPLGVPHIVVTHNPPKEWVKKDSPFTFVTDGVEDAIKKAKEAAGGKDVCISTAKVLQQCLNARLVDEIHLDLVDVLLGKGIPLFENLTSPIGLKCERAIAGIGVTHLKYAVIK
jgi:dihydrofolate reductase